MARFVKYNRCLFLRVYMYLYMNIYIALWHHKPLLSCPNLALYLGRIMSYHCASSLAYLVRDLWHGLNGTTIVGSFGVS